MKKLLSIVLLFSCLLETTPWNTMQPCIASTITPSEQIVESENTSISTKDSQVSSYNACTPTPTIAPTATVTPTSAVTTRPTITTTPTVIPTPIADCVVFFYDANSSHYTSIFVGGTNGSTNLPDYNPSLLANNETFIGWIQGNAPIIYDTKDSIDYSNILYPDDIVKVPRCLHFYPVILRESRTTTTSLPSQIGDSNSNNQPQVTPTLTPTVAPVSSPQVGNDKPNKQPQVTPTLAPTVAPVSSPQVGNDTTSNQPQVTPTLNPAVTPVSSPQIGNDTTDKPQKNPITYTKPKRIKNISWKKSVLYFSKVANVTGYQIKYSRTKNGKGKTITTKSCRKNMKPYHLKGIYYIKIRAYKKIEGTTIYGAWTITKKKF